MKCVILICIISSSIPSVPFCFCWLNFWHGFLFFRMVDVKKSPERSPDFLVSGIAKFKRRKHLNALYPPSLINWHWLRSNLLLMYHFLCSCRAQSSQTRRSWQKKKLNADLIWSLIPDGVMSYAQRWDKLEIEPWIIIISILWSFRFNYRFNIFLEYNQDSWYNKMETYCKRSCCQLKWLCFLFFIWTAKAFATAKTRHKITAEK